MTEALNVRALVAGRRASRSTAASPDAAPTAAKAVCFAPI